MYMNFDGETVISGNVGSDLTMSYTSTGTAIGEFSVAVDRWDYKSKKKTTTWYPCKAFGKLANNLDRDLKKGTRSLLRVRYETEGKQGHFFMVLGYELMVKENVVVDLG